MSKSIAWDLYCHNTRKHNNKINDKTKQKLNARENIVLLGNTKF